jgi:hypothetical protein
VVVDLGAQLPAPFPWSGVGLGPFDGCPAVQLVDQPFGTVQDLPGPIEQAVAVGPVLAQLGLLDQVGDPAVQPVHHLPELGVVQVAEPVHVAVQVEMTSSRIRSRVAMASRLVRSIWRRAPALVR